MADCAVIPIPDEQSGEIPKAFVVKSPSASAIGNDDLREEILKYVSDHKAQHKWLKGGVEFMSAIPKNANGKVLRRSLKAREAEAKSGGVAK